jgi:hypothetical protein
MKVSSILTVLLLSLVLAAAAQEAVNYDETKIEPYTLPELLIQQSGKPVRSAKDWEQNRRPEILMQFEQEVYGVVPIARVNPPYVTIIDFNESALNNTAIRKQVSLLFIQDTRELVVHILLYLPKGVANPPLFIGYNFYGNQTIHPDDEIVITPSWVPNRPDFGITDNVATKESRGKNSSRWPVETIISEGFGVATVYCGDFDPDKNDFTDGIHPFFYQDNQTQPTPYEWGTLGAWAWGLSRVMDYIKRDDLVKSSKTILLGHSRLGKAALWAGARDTRFDIVISNESGCGGAALSRRKFGETVGRINEQFPHWFAKSFHIYNGNESALPVDQHMLLALIAPRPLYVASAQDDRWADPKGEYLSAWHAGEVYKLYKKSVLPNPEPPAVNQPIHSTIGYHMRSGRHDITAYDWEQYLKFARKHLGR